MGQEDDGYICSSRHMRVEHNRRPDDFKRRILYRIPTDDHRALLLIEARWLDMVKENELGVRYYNNTSSVVCIGMKGYKQSIATRRRRSAANKGKPPSPETIEAARKSNTGRVISESERQKRSESSMGAKNGFFGRSHSEQAKILISAANKGKRPWLGKRHSEDTKRLIAKAKSGNKGRVGKIHTQETKDRISAAKRGKSLSLEHRRKIGDGARGKTRILSAEGLKNIRDAQRRRWGYTQPMKDLFD